MWLARNVFSPRGFFLVGFFLFGAIVYSLARDYEDLIFPVVTRSVVDSVEQTDEGLLVTHEFVKLRNCDYVGVSWYDAQRERISIVFPEEDSRLPTSRPTGPQHIKRPWLLRGITSLDGTRAVVSHRCHPLWLTHTEFWP